MKASLKPPTEPDSMPEAATVETTATPVEPPTSWKVLTTPDARPASFVFHHAQRGGGGGHEDRAETEGGDDEAGQQTGG
ncbi:hypothetical protein ABT063_28185 [Streptomyces sp. NPDC002838]|uniref:hypothetical protein n=1 Tax=Streptomyces sp. NPDC002838 TaxID=3154436 RepID=UPI00332FF453